MVIIILALIILCIQIVEVVLIFQLAIKADKYETIKRENEGYQKVINELRKSTSKEKPKQEEESEELSPFEFAEMIMKGKVDIEDELRE